MFDFDFRPLFLFFGIVGVVCGVIAVLAIQFLASHVSFNWS